MECHKGFERCSNGKNKPSILGFAELRCQKTISTGGFFHFCLENPGRIRKKHYQLNKSKNLGKQHILACIPSAKYARHIQKIDPNFRGKHRKKSIEPPPSNHLYSILTTSIHPTFCGHFRSGWCCPKTPTKDEGQPGAKCWRWWSNR